MNVGKRVGVEFECVFKQFVLNQEMDKQAILSPFVDSVINADVSRIP